MILLDRPRKSQRLTKGQHTRLIKWVEKQPTKTDAAAILNVQRGTLDRIILGSSGSPEVINRILETIKA